MRHAMPRRRPWPGVLLVVLLAGACSEPLAVAEPAPQFNKGKGGSPKPSAGIAVTAVEPSFGRQGQQLLGVRVAGSGFEAGAQAVWEVPGTGTPAPGIAVLATRFINSTTLEADISIADDAALSLYDVAVMSGPGKRGVGIEMFEVTTAQEIGTFCSNAYSSTRGINASGAIVGHSCSTAFYYDGTLVSLGTGIANDIDEAGNVVVGAAWSTTMSVQEGPALIWTRTGSAWMRAELPSQGMTARANAIASDANGNAYVIVGVVREPVNRKTTIIRPRVWRRSGSSWAIQALPLPGGLASNTSMRASDVNAAGHAVGGFNSIAVVWDPDGSGGYTATRLPGSGHAMAISADARLVAGDAGGVAAFWTRAAVGAAWSGPFALTAACTSSNTWANDIGDDGVIGGRGCKGAMLWSVAGGVSESPLTGLGRNDTDGEVIAVGSTRLAGNALGRPVYWDRW